MEEKLREMMHQMPVPDAESGLSRTIALAKIEAGKQKRSERISFARFFWLQGKYVGWKIWAAQLCMLLLITALTVSTFGTGFMQIPVYAIRYLSAFSGLIMLSAVPFFCRPGRWKMSELEAASYMSSKTLLAAKLIWTGAGNISVLTGVFLVMTRHSVLDTLRTGLCLLFPFLCMAAGCLFFLSHLRSTHLLWASAGLFAVVFLLIMRWSHWQPYLYSEDSFPAMPLMFAVVLILLVFLCVYQLWYLMCRSDYEELQLADGT